ncbi:response regulator [Ramlibacter terrae]|uniref:histidine kinase n=1 Tax=Ramlibacter terrae TaxID=2732511 RepID=A0ABX6P150_9BURK|nr:response regulator [Ramlibacter terrae]
MLDPDGVVLSWNGGAHAIKGYTAAEIVGRHFSVFYTPEDKAAGKPELELETAREVGRAEDEGWRVRKDGSMFWAYVVVTAIHGADGKLIGFAKVTRDMSDRRRLEELERSSRRMNEFPAMLAHELRNPLAPIRNAVTIMQLESLASPVLRNCRDVIDRQLTHVTRLVDDLLDVGRLSTGKIKLRKEMVRFSDVVARSVETARPLVAARRHTLDVQQPEEGVYVHGDATRLSQVLQNLLVNAAKYTPEGGHIRLTVQPVANFLDVTVADNGRGISPRTCSGSSNSSCRPRPAPARRRTAASASASRWRVPSWKCTAARSRRAARAWAGSSSTVRLPAASAVEQAEAEEARESGPAGLRVLVVDDNRDSADSATDVLRLLGNQVECAYDGESGVQLARRFRPHMVLLDLAMPGIDGFEARRRLLRDGGHEEAFFVAMTGFGNEEDKKRTQAAGFDAHLTKPVELDALITLLAQARDRRRRRGGPTERGIVAVGRHR